MSDIAINTKNASNSMTTITTNPEPNKSNPLDYLEINPGMYKRDETTITPTDIQSETMGTVSVRLDTSSVGADMPTPIFTVSPNTGEPQEVPRAVVDKVEETAVVAPKSYPGGYRHFADEIGETATLKWFTKDERELLISLYNRVNAGLKVEMPPQLRILTWVVQPQSKSGIQHVLLTTPFQGFVRGCVVSCDSWGTEPLEVTVKELDPMPGSIQGDVCSMTLPTIASGVGKYITTQIPGDRLFYKGSQFDIEVAYKYQSLPNTHPITVELILESQVETHPTYI